VLLVANRQSVGQKRNVNISLPDKERLHRLANPFSSPHLSEAKAAAPHPNLASLDPGCDDTISANYHSAQFCCNAGAGTFSDNCC
jgi:hypothetical protein